MSFYPVIVCGGRDFANKRLVVDTLEELSIRCGPLQIIHGGASGADKLAMDWALSKPYAHVSNVPADWKTHGKAAGPIRNQQMIDEYRPKLVVAFPGGKGTADMVRRALAANIHVVEIADDAHSLR